MNNNILQMFQAMQANPMQFIQRKFNVPGNITDPQQIVQHLLNSGQISQEQVNNAMQMRKQFFGN